MIVDPQIGQDGVSAFGGYVCGKDYFLDSVETIDLYPMASKNYGALVSSRWTINM